MHGSRSYALAASFLAALGGCYEIKPEVPRGYVGSQAEPGWPPPAVYGADVFHPANRLFQRLFVLGGESAGKAAAVPSADIPFSLRRDFGAVDLAEVAALIGTLERGAPGDCAPLEPAARALLQTDVLWIAARLGALRASRGEGGTGERGGEGSGLSRSPPPAASAGPPEVELSKDLARAALRLSGGGPLPASILPPPLREEPGWKEDDGPVPQGLRPSSADLRWTRTFHREGRGAPESALLRLRIGVGPDGGPVLLPLGSEAWFLLRGKGGEPEGRAFLLRRARLLRGEDPWQEVAGGEEIAILDPGDPVRDPLTGKVPALCAGCHGASSGKEGVPPGPAGEGQAARALRALEALFSKGR